MRLLEVFAVFLYFGVILKALDIYSNWLLMKGKDGCFKTHQLTLSWAGNTIHWFYMEIIVFLAYMCTMVILLIKSRFFRVGVD